RVVAQVERVVAPVRGSEVDDEREVGGGLDGVDAETAHLFGQARQRLRDAVLDLDLRTVDVGADLEGHRERERTVHGGGRGHVEHVLAADDRLLEGGCHRVGDYPGV